MLCCLSRPDRLCLGGLMSCLNVLLVSGSVLFLAWRNHLHCRSLCVSDGCFSCVKHSWSLSWDCLRSMLCLRTHFKASAHALLSFMCADVCTPSDQDRQSMSESAFPHDRLFKPSEQGGLCQSVCLCLDILCSSCHF